MKSVIEHLKGFLEEEEHANLEYQSAINTARRANDRDTAKMLESIQSDEIRHTRLLRKRLSELKVA